MHASPDLTAAVGERPHLRAILHRLPLASRTPFLLFQVRGLSCAQIADALGTTPRAVEDCLQRAYLVIAAERRAREGLPRERSSEIDR